MVAIDAGLEARDEDFDRLLNRRLFALTEELGVDFALASRLTREGTHFRSLALCARAGARPDFELALTGTPCEAVLARGVVHEPVDLVARYPQDVELAQWGAVSYVGVALRDAQGRPIGHLAVLDSEPIHDASRAKRLLRRLAREVARRIEARRARRGEEALRAPLRAGQERAFEEWVRASHGRLLSVARRLLRSEDEAHDAVQDALLAGFRALGSFEGHAALATWMHRITVNAALMRLRAERRRPVMFVGSDVDLEHLADRRIAECPWGDTHAAIERRELREVAVDIVASLPDLLRPAWVLREIEGLSTRETAHRLGITEANVKTRCHRARSHLRRQVELLHGRLDPEFLGT